MKVLHYRQDSMTHDPLRSGTARDALPERRQPGQRPTSALTTPRPRQHLLTLWIRDAGKIGLIVRPGAEVLLGQPTVQFQLRPKTDRCVATAPEIASMIRRVLPKATREQAEATEADLDGDIQQTRNHHATPPDGGAG